MTPPTDTSPSRPMESPWFNRLLFPVLLYCNFFVLDFYFYNYVLTDQSAFCFVLLLMIVLAINMSCYTALRDPCLMPVPSKFMMFLNVICGAISLYWIGITYAFRAMPVELLKIFNNKKVLLMLIAVALMAVLLNHLSSPGTMSFGVYILMDNISLGIKYPFFFFVNHILYFGIGAVLIALTWKKFTRKCLELGAGFYLVILSNVFFCMTSESRILTPAFPFYIYALFQVLQEEKITWKVFAILSGIQIVLSRVWMPFNANPESTVWNSYLMNSGPWMTIEIVKLSYIFTIIISIATLCVFYLGRKGERKLQGKVKT